MFFQQQFPRNEVVPFSRYLVHINVAELRQPRYIADALDVDWNFASVLNEVFFTFGLFYFLFSV
jgi:hypothetical protein